MVCFMPERGVLVNMSDYSKWLFSRIKEYWWIITISIVLCGSFAYGVIIFSYALSAIMFSLMIAFGISLAFYLNRDI